MGPRRICSKIMVGLFTEFPLAAIRAEIVRDSFTADGVAFCDGFSWIDRHTAGRILHSVCTNGGARVGLWQKLWLWLFLRRRFHRFQAALGIHQEGSRAHNPFPFAQSFYDLYAITNAPSHFHV